MLERRLGPVMITGRVVDIDTLERGWRHHRRARPAAGPRSGASSRGGCGIHITATSDLLAPRRPACASRRCSIRCRDRCCRAGTICSASCISPRSAGSATAMAARRQLVAADCRCRAAGAMALRDLRTEMTRRITAVLPGSTGGVASALDHRQARRDRRDRSSRRSAIPGCRICWRSPGCIWGWSAPLSSLRARRSGADPVGGAALSDQEDRRGGNAWSVLTCYLMISGAAIPTERAFVMNGIVFAGDPDRPAADLDADLRGSPPSSCWLLDPASLVGVSFQMSFGAVVALIAVYETWGAQLGRTVARPLAGRACARLLRRGRGDDRGRDDRHRPVLDLPFPSLGALFAARQCHRGAAQRDVDPALGRRVVPA